MAEFKNVTFMLGAVDETDSLRKTVLTVLDLCNPEDVAEIIIGYSQHITEESLAVVRELEATVTAVPVVTFMQKGKGIAALTEMIDIARGSHCVLLASDMALDLNFIPEMIEGVKKNGDVIVSSSRFLPGCNFYDYKQSRHFLNVCAQAFLRVLFGTKVTDLTNPTQIVPTEVYQSIDWESKDFSILLEMMLKPLRLGCKFTEVPTNCYARKQGKSHNSFMQTAGYLKTALHIRFMPKKNLIKKGSALDGKI